MPTPIQVVVIGGQDAQSKRDLISFLALIGLPLTVAARALAAFHPPAFDLMPSTR